MNYDNSDNERLKQLVDIFMSEYVGLFLASFSTGKIEFIKFKDGLLEHFGVRGEVPEWEEFVLLYTSNGVYRNDQAMVRAFLERDYLREHLHVVTASQRSTAMTRASMAR